LWGVMPATPVRVGDRGDRTSKQKGHFTRSREGTDRVKGQRGEHGMGRVIGHRGERPRRQTPFLSEGK